MWFKDSKLDELKLLDDFDFDFQKSIDKKQIMDLAPLSFAQRGQWLILAGSSGTQILSRFGSYLVEVELL